MVFSFHPFATLPTDRRGVALVEFAITLPLLLYLILGILTYGQYFLLAHSAQQLANDAARSTIAGLTGAERASLAGTTISREAASLDSVKLSDISHSIREDGKDVMVTVRIDASRVPLISTHLIPVPDPMIERRAVIAMGGIS